MGRHDRRDEEHVRRAARHRLWMAEERAAPRGYSADGRRHQCFAAEDDCHRRWDRMHGRGWADPWQPEIARRDRRRA